MLYRLIQSGWTILLLFCATYSYSQDFIYRHYDMQDGLPNPTVHTIFQDKDGFIWFGTESGVCRYDGSNYKIYTVKDGLPTNRVIRISQDKKGRIWIQQLSGRLAYILNDKVYNQHNDTLLKKVKLNSGFSLVVDDAKENIIIADASVIYILSEKDGKLSTIETLNGAPLNIFDLHIDSSGKIMVLLEDDPYLVPFGVKGASAEEYEYRSVSWYELQNGAIRHFKTVYKYNKPESLAGTLVSDHYTVLGFFDDKKIILLTDTVVMVSATVGNTYMFSGISDSVISFNTMNGASLYNIKTGGYTHLLPGVIVYSVFLDREKNLWIGTGTEGVYKISSEHIKKLALKNNRNDICYISKIGGRIVTGNTSKEVYAFNKDWKEELMTPPGTSEFRERVLYYEKTGSNKYFLAYSSGLVTVEAGAIKEKVTTNVARVYSMDKDRILAATHYGIFICNKHDLSMQEVVWRRKTYDVLSLGNNMLVGGYPGLFVMKKTPSGYVVTDSLLPSILVRQMRKTDDGLVWICSTERGLYCYKEGKIIRHFTDDTGLPSNHGRSLAVQGNDVWVGTDKGLAKISRVDDSFHIQKFTTADGLSSDIINSIYVDGNMVYLGTPKGLCFFDETLINTFSISNLVLTGVSIDDSVVDHNNKYFLRANQRFRIEYAGISLRSEKEMSYQYIIHGLDEKWRTTNLNVLEFAALPMGEYEIELVALNKFGKKSQPIKIAVEVIRPFYKTTWFVLLMIAVPVVIILFLVNKRLSRERQKQVQKLEQEIRIIKLEQMALRAQMNPHFIFNCISVMQQLVTEKDTDNASRFIASFAELVRQTLDNAPELFIPLTEEIKFLTNYFELERIRLEDRFAYAIRTESLHNKEKISVPNMVIQPFVENAIRHGIRYKKNGKGFIEVLFEQKENLLRCTITDNGIGREKAMQLRKESGISHQSQGMSITMRRIESLNAVARQKIFIEIEDLEDEQQVAAGTRVRIDFHNINEP